jgi:hypothetical protein
MLGFLPENADSKITIFYSPNDSTHLQFSFNMGADAVKFQTFNSSQLTTSNAKKADYQIQNTGLDESQQEMLKRLELSPEAYLKIKRHCDDLGIEFMSTGFDVESLEFLLSEVGLFRIKIPSGEKVSSQSIRLFPLNPCSKTFRICQCSVGVISGSSNIHRNVPL